MHAYIVSIMDGGAGGGVASRGAAPCVAGHVA
jgi:hypothetical protein